MSAMSEHNHDMNERKIESKQFRVMAKRKAARPSKIIRQELQKLDESNLQTKALKNVALAVYRERRRELPVCAMICSINIIYGIHLQNILLYAGYIFGSKETKIVSPKMYIISLTLYG
jgi:hypothetical protein